MPFSQTEIPGLVLFEPKVFGDDRGHFFESYSEREFDAAGITAGFVQDNQAFSGRGVLRGLHYQVAPFEQAKLVRVLQGEVLDVAVDIRPESATFGHSYSCVLSAENRKQLFVPRGFAHGYAVLSETATFFYKCDNYYSKEHEGGIRPDCPILNIDWMLDLSKVIVAARDKNFPSIGKHRTA
ncbi:MAG: dTDP-4-dehydrorhamnose 3,5-epimerase [Saprospiraceae bacterium]|nr:MAG: dTDP-4-dehydrorhamnose 3,5-epimerase [Saprospiraceae bacterium]